MNEPTVPAEQLSSSFAKKNDVNTLTIINASGLWVGGGSHPFHRYDIFKGAASARGGRGSSQLIHRCQWLLSHTTSKSEMSMSKPRLTSSLKKATLTRPFGLGVGVGVGEG